LKGALRPLRVGLTGGVGSGKSTVASHFEALGVPVIDADRIARLLVAPGQPALLEVAAYFGDEVIKDGQLDRTALRQKIFADDHQRRWLERLLHPKIYAAIEQQIAAQSAPYVLVVVPLLLETGRLDLVDRLLVVDVDPILQIQRVVGRDQLESSEVEKMLEAQINRETRLLAADDVLDNSGSPDDLPQKVLKLNQAYLNMAARHR
jgi:dephospho-CoA kinase